MTPFRKLMVFTIIVGLALSQWGVIIHPADGATVTVNIQNFAFNPQNATSHIGDSVIWTNNDPVIYTLWFKNASDGSTYLLSQPINPGTTWTHVFPDKIILNYYDFDRLYITGRLIIVLSATVRGVVVPVDKLALLTPLIGLASLIFAATTVTAVYVWRAKQRRESMNKTPEEPQQSRFPD
jgi:plastocyanin